MKNTKISAFNYRLDKIVQTKPKAEYQWLLA